MLSVSINYRPYPTLLLLNTHKLHFCQNKQYRETERNGQNLSPASHERRVRVRSTSILSRQFANFGEQVIWSVPKNPQVVGGCVLSVSISVFG